MYFDFILCPNSIMEPLLYFGNDLIFKTCFEMNLMCTQRLRFILALPRYAGSHISFSHTALCP